MTLLCRQFGHGLTSRHDPQTGAGVAYGAHRRSLRPATSCISSSGEIANFHPPARGDAFVECREALSHSTRSVHISLRDPSPPRPRTSSHDHSPPLILGAEHMCSTRVHCVNTCVSALSEHTGEHDVFMNTRSNTMYFHSKYFSSGAPVALDTRIHGYTDTLCAQQ